MTPCLFILRSSPKPTTCFEIKEDHELLLWWLIEEAKKHFRFSSDSITGHRSRSLFAAHFPVLATGGEHPGRDHRHAADVIRVSDEHLVGAYGVHVRILPHAYLKTSGWSLSVTSLKFVCSGFGATGILSS